MELVAAEGAGGDEGRRSRAADPLQAAALRRVGHRGGCGGLLALVEPGVQPRPVVHAPLHGVHHLQLLQQIDQLLLAGRPAAGAARCRLVRLVVLVDRLLQRLDDVLERLDQVVLDRSRHGAAESDAGAAGPCTDDAAGPDRPTCRGASASGKQCGQRCSDGATAAAVTAATKGLRFCNAAVVELVDTPA